MRTERIENAGPFDLSFRDPIAADGSLTAAPESRHTLRPIDVVLRADPRVHTLAPAVETRPFQFCAHELDNLCLR